MVLKTHLTYLPAMLLIIQREQQRLNELVPTLQRRELGPNDLCELRRDWQSSLSLFQISHGLNDWLDDIIDEYANGKVHKQTYRGLVRKMETYEQGSRLFISERHGPYRQFLDNQDRVLTRYKQAFEHVYERDAPLSHELQASMVLHLLDGYDLPRLEPCPNGAGLRLVYDTARPVEQCQVIDLELARRRRNQ